jgi:hypothetical protein
MTTLLRVPVEAIPETLPRVRGLLEQMRERRPDWATDEQIAALLAHDYLQLHLALDEHCVPLAALLTEIKATPSGKRFCCLVGIAGVNRHMWTDHLDDIEQWARAHGCSAVQIVDGRKGWLREEKLKPYRVTHTFWRDIA